MQTNYDVIIIGAGPSGASCAYNLKRNKQDLTVLLVDKAEFPRYKPCGGGISPEVANYLDFDLQPAIDSVCHDVVMVANQQEISGDQHQLWMVRREKFDQYLVEQARAAGVDFKSGCEVTTIEQTPASSQVRVSAGETVYSAAVVVIAEGGRGKLAKKLGYAGKNTVLAAMEYEHYTERLSGRLYIDFDYNDSGYAWNFPKSDGLSLGIGGHLKGQDKGKVGLPQKLHDYSQQFGVDNLAKNNLHGHPIMLYSGRQQLVHDKVVLIGEIAGCVDPLTAEGIRPAIKSGYLAAKVIAQAVDQKKPALLKHYDQAFHQEIGRDLAYARVVAYFLNKNLKRVLPMLTTPRAINAFMDVFSGKLQYRDKIGFCRIVKMLWRSWF